MNKDKMRLEAIQDGVEGDEKRERKFVFDTVISVQQVISGQPPSGQRYTSASAVRPEDAESLQRPMTGRDEGRDAPHRRSEMAPC